jgi:hypothetical protein
VGDAVVASLVGDILHKGCVANAGAAVWVLHAR